MLVKAGLTLPSREEFGGKGMNYDILVDWENKHILQLQVPVLFLWVRG